MIFSELYGAYYGAVAAILKAAAARPLKREEMRRIVGRHAFGESMLTIPAALEEGRWPLLTPEGRSVLAREPSMPLTALEKSWLNAVAADPRVRLFTDDPPVFPEVPPLFRQEDILVFDRYADGDPYEDDGYIRRFRLILGAVRDRTPLKIGMITGRGKLSRFELLPDHLEYSEKDDKFRLIGVSPGFGRRTVNLGRITDAALSGTDGGSSRFGDADAQPRQRTVEFELRDERNALERALLHFAHFRKEAEKRGDGVYLVRVSYDAEDEAEMVIRILSFGPMIRVTSPETFVGLIRERLLLQKNCGL